jgi:predicted extracellular nuclease
MNRFITTVTSIFLSIFLISCGANTNTEKTIKKDSIECMQASDFIVNYGKNHAEYDKKYLDEAVTVQGEVVVSESMDEDGFKVEIKGNGEDETVNCIFDKTALSKEKLPKIGDIVVIKGKCTGYMEEDMIGLKTITMVQCLIIQ